MRALRRTRRIPVGQDEPRTPKRSLPSYQEPTPETHRKLTREDEAEIALKRTVFTQGTPHVLIALFLLTILAVPLIQIATDRRPFNALKTILPGRQGLPTADQLKAAEKTLETDSAVTHWLLPPAQSLLIGKLRAGNEQVYVGRDGWLFYRPDVDYVTGPAFLSPSQMHRRKQAAKIEPDPVKAIVHFRDQLAARGIELVVVPAPTKATVHGELLSARALPNEPLQNASFGEFGSRLAAAGVRLFDPTPLLMQQKSAPVYLKTDTHWQPEMMQIVPQELARFVQLPAPAKALPLQVSDKVVEGIGDISRMLKLPDQQPERAIIQQVTSGNALWRPTRDADVLLLGDSFTNVFSLEALGWGESAGFAEHLSAALGGRALDCIVRNSDGAFATREMLANELARGRDRLAGKKLVVWQFAARELAFGNWKLLEMKLGEPQPARFFSPGRGEIIEVNATVEAISSVPRPGSVPYADHVMAVQLAEIDLPSHTAGSLQAIVYLASMRDNVWTPAARLRPGDRIKVRLRAWSDVAGKYEQINRSELDDADAQLEEPAWGELL